MRWKNIALCVWVLRKGGGETQGEGREGDRERQRDKHRKREKVRGGRKRGRE